MKQTDHVPVHASRHPGGVIQRRTVLMTGAALTGVMGGAGLLLPALSNPAQAGGL
ncbi:hypothetical protein [Streptomyces phaeochromogenes]|uniref:hypothetical protein n=1 Tax=Streptomyces phaeochromogenes TaxID=1923 RepID=UPI0027D7D75B|nr:hypothetical protein [Streptomyces phaeochromogenes]